MNWNEISVSTTTQATEIISKIFIEIGSKGVMIEAPSDFQYQTKDELAWDYIEKEVFDYGHEDVKIIGYFSQEEDIEQKINDLKERLLKLGDIGVELGTLEISHEIIYHEYWENEWKKYCKTQNICIIIVIKPSWENYEKQADEKIIEIDPGMAFGTGTHETTKMCINAIEKYIKSEDTLIDIGCGSGILSIAGAILGAKKVIAVDLDKLAVKISKENVELNNYQDIIEVRHGNLTDVITEKADIIVANIIADAIVMLSENIKDFMKEDAYFISSGIINEKVDYVKENLIKNGFEIIEHNNDKEWNCIVAKVNKTDV